MRIFSFDKKQVDKRYIVAYAIVVLCGIVCGIVLFRSAKINTYLKTFAKNYINYVYSFNNASLIFPRLFCEIAFCYIFYFLGKKRVFSYLSLAVLFLRVLFVGLYTAMLFSCYSFGGAMAAILVYIPLSILSVFCYFACARLSGCVISKYRIFFPLALVLAGAVLQIILVNIVFRAVIIIV